MIVYGHEPIRIPPCDFLSGYRRRLLEREGNLEEARVRLVLAGQLEQAALDGGFAWAVPCRELTATAAEAFIKTRQRVAHSEARSRLLTLSETLVSHSNGRAQQSLEMRTPEGFAWYALYPDAYADTAAAWASAHTSTDRVLVIGIRSIGTTLAAVVAAVLRSRGFAVATTTVRPTGHPFDRRTSLPENLPAADQAIIVDEGPGLSGSSMASVAQTFAKSGLPLSAITFFPGHGNGPGPMASPEVSGMWADVRCSSLAWHDTSIENKPAADCLSEKAARLLGEPLDGVLQEVGGGRWRHELGRYGDGIRAFAPAFENPKLLARSCSGRKLLLKFAGFAMAPPSGHARIATLVEQQRDRLARLAEAGFTVPPAAALHGWLVLPWIEGRRLCAVDADADLMTRMAGYIAAAAGPALAPSDSPAASARLREIVITNSSELLGPEASAHAARAADRIVQSESVEDVPTYGDGRLAPHEWVGTPARLLKVDAGGHETDHTAVGRQPIWWDIAGASVEWNLGERAAERLAHLAGATTTAFSAAYYRAVYAAFRGGLAFHCRSLHPDGPEGEHLTTALKFYRAQLEHELRRLEATA